MQVQRVFKAGNSNVVSIPKHLLQEVDIKSGQKVIVEKSQNEGELIIKKVGKSKFKKSRVDEDFKKWWKAFLRDNEDVLDELALR
jgi:antitoxin component of MazEF toxin-antitoxin module